MRYRNLFIGLFCAALFQLPLLAFWFSGRSMFLNYWEFASDHYYGSMSILHRDFGAVFIVQGIPMALLQTQFLRLISHLQPGSVGSVGQIDLFAGVTAWFAYLATGALLLGLWISRRFSLADKACVSGMTIAIWPLARHYSLLQAPFYWIYEVPLYVLFTLWTLRIFQRYRDGAFQPPGSAFYILCGAGTGLAFLQKPSLMAFAVLPAIVALVLGGRRWYGQILRVLLLAGTAAATHWFVFLLYFDLQWSPGQRAYNHYWDWLLHSPDAGTSLATSFGELLRWSNFLFVPVALGLAVLAAVSVLAARGKLSLGRPGTLFCVIGFLWLTALGHAAVIVKRPSGTSVVDAAFFGAFIIPVFVGLAEGRLQRRLGATLAATVAIACVAYQPLPFGHWSKVDESSTLRAIEAVRLRTQAIGRPIILLLPNNLIHPYTAEAFGLYTGHLNLEPQGFDAQLLPRALEARLLRQRLYPNTFMINRGENAQLVAAINAGYLIMWGEGPKSPGIPRIQDYFPEIDGLLRDPNLSHDVFEMLPGGIRNAHLAYLKDKPVPVPR